MIIFQNIFVLILKLKKKHFHVVLVDIFLLQK